MEALSKLGIDFNSVILYLFNFGILFAVIAYFVTGPILKMLDDRKKTIKDNLEQAERIKNEFMREKVKSEKEKESMRVEMEKELADTKKEMDAKRRKMEEAMDLKKAKMLEEMRTVIEDEKGKIMKKAEQQTLDLIGKVIMHVVSNKIPQDVVKDSVNEAWKIYHK